MTSAAKFPESVQSTGPTCEALAQRLLTGSVPIPMDLAQAVPEPQRQTALMLQKLSQYLSETDLLTHRLAEGHYDDAGSPRLDPANPYTGNLRTVRSNLSHLAWVSRCVAHGEYDHHVGFMGDFSDSFNFMIGKLREQKKQLERAALVDSLTGLGNRHAFNLAIRRLMQSKTACTVAFIDLDRLKYCNDQFGHSAGDQYIAQVAEYLSGHLADHGQVYRIGGDEFVFVGSGESAKAVAEHLESLRSALLESQQAGGFRRCFSYGCAHLAEFDERALSTCLEQADRRMYIYKKGHLDDVSRLVAELEASPSDGALESRIFEALSQTARNRYLFVCDVRRNVSRWSRNVQWDFEMPEGLILDAAKFWGRLIHPDDRKAWAEDIAAVFAGKKSDHMLNYRVLQRDGSYAVCSCNACLLPGENPLFIGTIINHAKPAVVDPITGLYNTSEFLRELERNRQESASLVVVGIGISRMSSINRIHSYATGNLVLRELAAKLEAELPRGRRLYRITGTRFACILPLQDRAELTRFDERLRAVARWAVSVRGTQMGLFLRLAALQFHSFDMQATDLLSELDHALYISKHERDGSLVLVGPGQHDELRGRLSLLERVRTSILAGCKGFFLVYQPQTDFDGCVKGVEALLRYRDKNGEVVSPGAFIPILEDEPCFYELGTWVLRTALSQVAPLAAEYPALTLSINVSTHQRENANFRADLKDALDRTGFPARRLIVEMTEHARPHEGSHLQDDIDFLHSIGVQMSADDFGTGYSTLTQVLDVPYDEIKIDRRFVAGVDHLPRNELIVRMLVHCTHTYHMRAVAEGVETEAELACVRKNGVDLCQGFYFSRPLEWPALTDYLKTHLGARQGA